MGGERGVIVVKRLLMHLAKLVLRVCRVAPGAAGEPTHSAECRMDSELCRCCPHCERPTCSCPAV